MGRKRPPKNIRDREKMLKLASIGTYTTTKPASNDSQRGRPHFYRNPVVTKRCAAKPTKTASNAWTVWHRLGSGTADAFGYINSGRIAATKEEEFTEEEINAAVDYDSNDEYTIYRESNDGG